MTSTVTAVSTSGQAISDEKESLSSLVRAPVSLREVGKSGEQADISVDISGLSLTFQTADTPVIALDNIELTIRRGEFVSFIGPSGCGKTTLMRVIEIGRAHV